MLQKDWPITFSLKQILLWLIKLSLLVVVTFWAIYLFYPALTNQGSGMAPWVDSLSVWWLSIQKIPLLLFDTSIEFLVLLPVVLPLALAAVALGMAEGSHKCISGLRIPEKKQLRDILIIAGVLVIWLVMNTTISRGFQWLGRGLAFDLPRPMEMGWEPPQIDTSLPGDYTLYCALLVGVIYLLAKKCMIYKRSRKQNPSVTVLAPATQLQ